METQFVGTGSKLNQVGSEIHEQKLNQTGSEMIFHSVFAYVPWKHHILIVQKSKSIDEALFYIQKTIEGSLSRNALDDVIRADLYHSSGNALTNFTEHMLRHNAASTMVKNEVPIETIAAILGHATPDTTDIYITTDVKRLKECVLSMDGISREVYHA